MGCSACNNKNKDSDTEMKDGNLPDSYGKGKPILETINTETVNINQSRSNNIFDFFNDLRKNPKNYIEESKKYNLDDIITLADNNKLYGNSRMLIQNHFFNLILDTSIQKEKISKENILTELENNTQLKNYEKILYIIKSESENPKDFVWLLLQENKDIALDEILYKNFDFFVVSSTIVSSEIYAYFLFLKKKE